MASDEARSETYDVVVIGAGMGGLTVASLLAKAGARVAVLEAHDVPGGCCHTFAMGPHYRFCAAVHYIFSCGEGEPVHNLVTKLGLEDELTFERLDPDGYDHFRCPSASLSFRIPNGLPRFCARLCESFPAEATAIRAFFDDVVALADHLEHVPDERGMAGLARALIARPGLLALVRWRGATLQALFDRHRLSARVQAVLATQVGDLGLPPNRVSLFLWIALVVRYGAGAYYPTEHFSTFIDKIAGVVARAPGCTIAYETEVVSAVVERGRLAAVTTKEGRTFRADRFICNADPRWFADVVGRAHFPRGYLARVDTEYSASSFSVYLGVRGLDLRAHGFGNWNVWHYPRLDINATYAAQHERDDLSDPWLFLSTPTLCSPRATTKHCPDGEQILEIITTCAYEPFRSARERGVREYTAKKNAVRDRMIEIVEQNYVPDLRKHVVMRVAGSPTTNRRYLFAPAGNIYGSALTPANVDASRLGARTPLENLFFVGASASFPSIGGTVGGGIRLYAQLTGDHAGLVARVARASAIA